MREDPPGETGPEQPDPNAPQGAETPDESSMGMGPPSGVPGGYGSEAVYGETVVEQRGWFSGARLTALITALVLVIAGTAVAIVLSGGDARQLEEVVPAGAVAFGKLHLLPSNEQRDAVGSLIERFPLPEGEEFGDVFGRLLDEGLAEQNMSFEQDIQPWLGSQIGFVVTDVTLGVQGPQATWAFLAAVRDESRARTALDRIKQDEPDMVYDIREGTAFISDQRSLQTVLGAVDGDTGRLSDDATFSSTIGNVDDDYIGLVYFDGEQLESLIPEGSLPVLPGLSGAIGRQVVIMRAEQNAVVIDGFSTASGPGTVGTPALVEGVSDEITGELTLFDPATTIEQLLEVAGLFLGFQPGFGGGFGGGFDESAGILGQEIPDARQLAEQFLQQTFGLSLDDDILPWLHGEFSIVVGQLALAQPEVGALIESTDDAAAGRTIDALRENLGAIGRGAGFEVTSAPGGFAVTFQDLPVSMIVRRVAGKVVIASSDSYADELLNASPQALAADTVYRQAVGEPGADDVAFQMLVRIDRIASFLQVFVPPAEYAEAEQYFDPLQAFGIRVTSGDDGSRLRMVLTFD